MIPKHSLRRPGSATCFVAKFLGTGKRIVDTGSVEMNHAAIHSLGLLYASHAAARRISTWHARSSTSSRTSGQAIMSVPRLAGKEFYQCRKPRWESLHAIQGIAQLYWLTGDENDRTAFERLWWSIVKLDRHNNGGFSSGEQAAGEPLPSGRRSNLLHRRLDRHERRHALHDRQLPGGRRSWSFPP